MASLSSLIARLIIKLIHGYQIISNLLLGHHCRFHLTCSAYGIKVIYKFGVFKGCWITLKRILKCHPFACPKEYIIVFNQNFVNQGTLTMYSQRNFFIIALLIVSFIIWETWRTEHPIKSNIQKNTQSQYKVTDHKNNYNAMHVKEQNEIITIQTDVLLLKINTYGGDIEEAYLLTYFDKLDSKTPFNILENSKQFIYQAKSWVTNHNNENFSNTKNTRYTINAHQNTTNTYVLMDYENEIKLSLSHTDPDGNIYTKTYILKRNDFAIHINHSINNISNKSIDIRLYGQLNQTINLPKSRNTDNNNLALYTYRGSAYYTKKNKYQKYSFKEIKKDDLHLKTKDGWVAMLQQYFAVAWIPYTQGDNTFYTMYNNNNNQAIIGFKSSCICLPPKSEGELKAILWLGPKIQDKMVTVSPNLDLAIDYGWLSFISQPLFKLLQFIYTYVGNWGVSIIIITLTIRLIMYPLTKAQYTSMAKIRMLQPKIEVIQKQFKNDKHHYHKEIMELYKTQKVNPLGGCLPLIVQMPIFLALYYMLSGSVELRHAKFILWINDLSAQDPYYILPILMGISMFFIQKMSPTAIDNPMQKKIMNFMLIIFTIFFLWFPSGLVLYYIVSNLITIIQQQIIYYGLNKSNINNKKFN